MGKMKLRSASPQSTGPTGASPSSTSRLPAGTNGSDEGDADPSSRTASPTAGRAVAALAEGRGPPERKRSDGGKVTVVDEKSSKAQGQALDFAIGQIKKKCGQGSVMYLGADFKANVDVITTGVLSLDHALGVGGIPRGRVIEIFGPESSGKTTLTLHLVANAQRAGGNAAFIDAEHALDPSYAKRLGVNLDTLLVSQPDSGEQALEIAEMLISSNAMAIVVVDSVAALVPRAELDGEMGDSHVGLQARLMSQALRKLTAVVNKTNTCLVFINQIREKIGVMFGSPETTTGGRALKFYSSVRLDIRRITAIKDGEEVKGNRTRVKVVKNKVAPPFRQSEFDILFDRGISRSGDLVDLAVEHSVIQRSGTWHSRGEMRLGQGRDRAVQFLEENPDVLRQVDEELRAKLGLPPS
ncbi:MAG TPA: recombinase RecA [Planctomycetota bacterium]|nr:recombinase RecA [Planctomycetota bacterium]